MRGLSLLLLVAMIAAAAFSLAGLDRNVAVDARLTGSGTSRAVSFPLSGPIDLDASNGDTLLLSVQGYGSDHVSVLEVVADAPVKVINGEGRNAERTDCLTTCRVVVRTAGEQPSRVRILSADGLTALDRITFEPVTAKRHGAASGAQIMAGFGLLLLFGPVLVWLRRWPGAEQVALVAAGLTWIGFASATGLVVAVGFVGAGYVVITAIGKVQSHRARALAAALGCITLLLILLKFAAPLMASAFANPGGLWLALPLGVSYLAIRVVDLVLAAHARALRGLTLRDYLAFMLSPYTLPAGPIQLYGDFLRGRIENWSGVDLVAGGARMGVGLSKKMLADGLLLPLVTGHMGAYLTGADNAERSILIMLVANMLYIYLDFSAYCDLAIGAARAGGRRLPENFDWPLVRGGLRAFWRHWHMSLSQWVMRRVYFPAFLASHSTTLALLASMLTIGLWHAPTISWSIWALHHSLAMAAEGRLAPGKASGPPLHRTTIAHIQAAGRHMIGMGFMLSWVALGHAFTLFAAPRVAIETYLRALAAPFVILWQLVG